MLSIKAKHLVLHQHDLKYHSTHHSRQRQEQPKLEQITITYPTHLNSTQNIIYSREHILYSTSEFQFLFLTQSYQLQKT